MKHLPDASVAHYAWDRTIPPRLEITPGDTVVLETRDGADGFYGRASTSDDIRRRGDAPNWIVSAFLPESIFVDG